MPILLNYCTWSLLFPLASPYVPPYQSNRNQRESVGDLIGSTWRAPYLRINFTLECSKKQEQNKSTPRVKNLFFPRVVTKFSSGGNRNFIYRRRSVKVKKMYRPWNEQEWRAASHDRFNQWRNGYWILSHKRCNDILKVYKFVKKNGGILILPFQRKSLHPNPQIFQ